MSTIEWTERTWNPTVGCSKVSPGCDHCYAVTVAQRQMQPAHRGLTAGGDWTGEVRLLPDRLETPLRRKQPTRYFVDSMSDLFHPDVPDEFIARVFGVMAAAGQHTFQVLTKRPQRMANVLHRSTSAMDRYDWWATFFQTRNEAWCDPDGWSTPWPLPNVWLGVSIESQTYDWRARHLLDTPAAVRFVSAEPLLGPLDLAPYLRNLEHDWHMTDGRWHDDCSHCLRRRAHGGQPPTLDWVIVGGESGAGARPIAADWVRDIRDRCQTASVAFFFKQWGGRSGRANGRTLDGRTWDEYPAMVAS